MRVLVAPDKFKGTLSAAEAAEAIAGGLRAAGADVDACPIADGGEGTLDALVAAIGGSVMGIVARGPMGLPVRAHIAQLDDGSGVVELAQASGLALVADKERDPLRASTAGTGEAIKGALARRPTRLIIGIGGSATVDGGMGLGRALGLRFVDADGRDLREGGGALERLDRIDTERLDARLVAVPMLVAADVDTLLIGPEGAAATFGPQKGATPEMIEVLDRGLRRLGECIERDLHVPVFTRPAAGAAGGAGAMLMGLGADVRSGAEIVCEAVDLVRRVKEADLVVTGEGRLDAGTAAGKGPAVVARIAEAEGVPCVALVGEVDGDVPGFDEVRSLAEHFGDPAEARERPAAGLRALAARLGSTRRFG